MTKEDLKNSIKDNDKDKIMENISEITMDEQLRESCFDMILELFYSMEDKELLNQIDWFMYYALKKNTLEKALKIIMHERYKYERIKIFTHIYNVIFYNNNIASELYKNLIFSETRKYCRELIQLLDSTKINITILNLNLNEKILMFYKTMGLICPHIKNNMLLCFQLLEDDNMTKQDKNLLITFVRFYGWNWMGTSTKFIEEMKIKSESQKQLVELLNLYIDGIKEENFDKNLSKDFDIDSEIVKAKQRIQLEQGKKIHDESEKHSFFASLFPITRLLIGDKFSYIYEDNGKVYQKPPAPLQGISFEYEFPLDYLINPIDFDYTLNFLLDGGNYETNN